MDSVIFKDISEVQKEKRIKRKEMLELMIANPDWYKNETSEVTKKIQYLGQQIGSQSMDNSRPIQFIDINRFTKEEFLYLKWLGYSTDAINKALNISKTKFWKYKINTLT